MCLRIALFHIVKKSCTKKKMVRRYLSTSFQRTCGLKLFGEMLDATSKLLTILMSVQDTSKRMISKIHVVEDENFELQLCC